MDFGKALEALKEGKKVRRQSWDKGIYLLHGTIDQFGTDLILQYFVSENGTHVNRCDITTPDIFTEDWEIVN